MGTRFEEEMEKARRLYGPTPEGRILNTSHVRDRAEEGDNPPSPDSHLGRLLKAAADIYGPKSEGRILNTSFFIERD